MPISEDEGTVVTGRETVQRERWYAPIRCSVCTSSIWFRPIVLKEAVGAPEPRHEWVLCTPCNEALLAEMRRSSLQSPVRMRVAMGLVAAERSPAAYERNPELRSQHDLQRELTWFIRLLILFTLLHLVIFALLLVPK
ncbi:MAG: hypothetical protein M3Y81_20440 [Chloroflexota bacterium]|nr:hypothetical protein [Chloroflexota bacterium]